eukprot:12223475-Alexandrium_andersonii.AAC.1
MASSVEASRGPPGRPGRFARHANGGRRGCCACLPPPGLALPCVRGRSQSVAPHWPRSSMLEQPCRREGVGVRLRVRFHPRPVSLRAGSCYHGG